LEVIKLAKNFTVSLDEKIIDDIKRLSFETKKPQKELVTEILKEGIERLTK